jgi:hypothetical protein
MSPTLCAVLDETAYLDNQWNERGDIDGNVLLVKLKQEGYDDGTLCQDFERVYGSWNGFL